MQSAEILFRISRGGVTVGKRKSFSITSVLVFLVISACAPSEQEIQTAIAQTQYAIHTPTPTLYRPTTTPWPVQPHTAVTPKPVNSETYVVVHTTALYDSLSADAAQLEILSVGTRLTPIPGPHLQCQKTVEYGISLTQCKVKSMMSGRTGWVLRKWIEKE
jgi:hypothetical protein